jgi:hypothetical protein
MAKFFKSGTQYRMGMLSIETAINSVFISPLTHCYAGAVTLDVTVLSPKGREFGFCLRQNGKRSREEIESRILPSAKSAVEKWWRKSHRVLCACDTDGSDLNHYP